MEKTLPALLVAILVGAVYWPGIDGGFLFDDLANLPALGAYGRVDTLQTLLLYVTSGKADPAGRPLALLTFLIDARDWPAPALSFKITNILLHALNAVLLFRLVFRVETLLACAPVHAGRTAFFTAALWALHPLMLSTTLYIVQRETMLVATFMLVGLDVWIAARRNLDRGNLRIGWSLAMASGLGCTVLAVLCKGNGALLPLLLWTVDSTVLRKVSAPGGASIRAHRLLLVVPSAALAACLAASIPSFAWTAEQIRPWTLGDRVLTQPLVLLEYLHLLLLPRAMTAGLFQDGMAVASATSIGVYASVVFWIALLIAALRLRTRWPVFSLAVLFFLAGHLMESSVIPLELYFEHRNYVPAMLLFWPLARWFAAGPCARWKFGAGLAATAMLALVTHLGARTWGDTYALAQTWALLAPDSGRAQTFAAHQDALRGNLGAAERRLRRHIANRPDDLQSAVTLADLYCASGRYDAGTDSLLSTALGTARQGSRLALDWLETATTKSAMHSCSNLDTGGVARLLTVFESNRRLNAHVPQHQRVMHLRGKIALARHDRTNAVVAFDQNLHRQPSPALALNQAALLGNAGFPASGLAHLQLFEQLYSPSYGPWSNMTDMHDWLLHKTRYWTREIEAIRADLRDAASRADPAE